MKATVTFPSAGLKLAGILFTPDDHTGAPLPAVVVSHPGGGVKEQTASIYAERLAREGFAALVFDAAHQGDSEGTPRGLENPFQRAEDVRAAVTCLTTRDDIDASRIGALGICASGGYVPFAAQTDHRIKAVATVSAVDVRSLLVEGLGRTQGPEVLQSLLDQAGAARTAEAEGGAPAVLNWAPESPEGLEEAPTLYREAQNYYRTPRGGHRNSTNEWPLRSIDHIAQFDPYALIDLIAPRPLLMIVGSDSDTAYFSREAIEKAREPKELFVVDGATHVSLYDQDADVTPAVTRLTDFFGKHLAS
ncbi:MULTISPECIES: alpha/beta hydrolase [Streptomyces]|uniref:alpha/beta hydrolase n=1 Tax=Streptomyces TaxID=1883 RepID=UPI0021A9654C|nr:alpha/beta hydrolase [Streptomyces atratus]MCT2548176.1 alpha/beta hydrolase [Streptomyces atratus]